MTVTMSIGQWDALLATAYDRGCVLLELDDDEQPVRAYRRERWNRGDMKERV